MHTVYPVGTKPNDKWVVQFIGPEKGTNICWFKRFMHACEFASFLNGGKCPDEIVLAQREMA